MQEQINKPVFIVGSPRSGTSVLTWCLGQHPNIFAVNESTGIGDLALALAVCYQTKMGLRPDSLWAAMNVQQEEFFAAFGQTINELILRHRVDLERRQWEEAAGPNVANASFVTEQSTSIPKARWVDGTPLYSFHICGLRKLFPNARFIHIVRDVTSVVRSMLNFHRLAGVSLIANEQEAYDSWFRTVSACLLAEKAYGPAVVFRLRYSELVNQSEVSLQALLNFLGEPYAANCLTPLGERMNSSNVPADFKLGDPDSDPAVIERARQLYSEIESSPQPSETSRIATRKIESEFYRRAQYFVNLNSEFVKTHARAERLANEVQRKRATIRTLQERRRRHKLREFVFGQNVVAWLRRKSSHKCAKN
jgi:hypothetical protein